MIWCKAKILTLIGASQHGVNPRTVEDAPLLSINVPPKKMAILQGVSKKVGTLGKPKFLALRIQKLLAC